MKVNELFRDESLSLLFKRHRHHASCGKAIQIFFTKTPDPLQLILSVDGILFPLIQFIKRNQEEAP
ncbi:hypothetical protein SDC9_119949 [bioreactor metagenome]|uniref:Uncharacterized protein n=1 Tax=bioreactor metagenome TaxID=1076179 RepID=A0A645C904_9ZZZZ